MPEALVTTRDGVVILGAVVPAADALGTWQHHVDAFASTGLWPVILGSAPPSGGYDERARWIEDAAASYAPPAADILRAADALLGRSFLDAAEADERQVDVEDREDPDFWDYFDPAPLAHASAPIPRHVIPRVGSATIALIPVASAAEIPAVLGFGNWNSCPAPEAHVAVMRYWFDVYGAELQAMSPDTLEFHVGTPALEFDAALRVAIDQFVYAGDILMQGEHESVGDLAQALVGSDHWYFWWD